MANLEDTITGFVCGTDIEVERRVTEIPVGESIVKAWLTVKALPQYGDDKAFFQKMITATRVAGQGQITNDGSGTSHEAVLLFELTATDTVLLTSNRIADKADYFDIKVLTSATPPNFNTPFWGRIWGTPPITRTEA